MPAPKSTAAHLADGTFRADRHAKRRRVEAAQSGKPLKPPKELPPKLRPLWRRVVASIDAGWLAPADAWLLSALVVVLDQVQRDAAKVSDQGSVVKGARSGELVRNPFAISLRQNLDALLRLSVRFGLSPRDRALLATLAMPEAPTGAASELFEQLMQQFRAASDQAVEAEEW
jgi:P27 family predicted phage terminase small subunit